MTKFDRKAIMKKANGLRKVYGLSKSEALRKSWGIAKIEKLNAQVFELEMADRRVNLEGIRKLNNEIASLTNSVYPTITVEEEYISPFTREKKIHTYQMIDTKAYNAA